jgi:hypothetical protein
MEAKAWACQPVAQTLSILNTAHPGRVLQASRLHAQLGVLNNPRSSPLTELVSIRRHRVKVRPGSLASSRELPCLSIPLCPPELAPARARGFNKKLGLPCSVPPTGVASPAGALPLPVQPHEGEL